MPTTWALGYSIGVPGGSPQSQTAFGVGGAGGSFAYGDPATDFNAVTKVIGLVTKN